MCVPPIDLGCAKESHTHINGLTLVLDWTGQDLEELYESQLSIFGCNL